MKIESILFPTDFSHYNDAALKFASTLAAEAKAKLYIVHVHDIRDLGATMGEASYLYASNWRDQVELARDKLGTIRPPVTGVAFEHECLVGPPEDEIVNFATEKRVDLIVMASHGRTGLSRLLLGSVAEAVMRHAPCPVLIVKQPAPKDNTQSTAASGTKTGSIS